MHVSQYGAVHLLLNSLKVHILILFLPSRHLISASLLTCKLSFNLLLSLRIVEVFTTKANLCLISQGSFHIDIDRRMLGQVAIGLIWTNLFTVSHRHVFVIAACRVDHGSLIVP